jgi:hypothetical protein
LWSIRVAGVESGKAYDYSVVRVEILSITHPAAHWPKVAVTLTTEP